MLPIYASSFWIKLKIEYELNLNLNPELERVRITFDNQLMNDIHAIEATNIPQSLRWFDLWSEFIDCSVTRVERQCLMSSL